MAFSSIWIDRIGDGASISGLNQRLVPGESDGDPCPVVTVKPDVFVFGLWDRDCCFFTYIRQDKDTERKISFQTHTVMQQDNLVCFCKNGKHSSNRGTTYLLHLDISERRSRQVTRSFRGSPRRSSFFHIRLLQTFGWFHWNWLRSQEGTQ